MYRKRIAGNKKYILHISEEGIYCRRDLMAAWLRLILQSETQGNRNHLIRHHEENCIGTLPRMDWHISNEAQELSGWFSRCLRSLFLQ